MVEYLVHAFGQVITLGHSRGFLSYTFLVFHYYSWFLYYWGGSLKIDRDGTFIQMFLVDGVFHADPHAGNLLLLDDGRLGLIDFGQVMPT